MNSINTETVWEETYTVDKIVVEGGTASVLTAIHARHFVAGFTSTVCELQLHMRNGACSADFDISLTTEQMERLAEMLMRGAKQQRINAQRVVLHNALLKEAA